MGNNVSSIDVYAVRRRVNGREGERTKVSLEGSINKVGRAARCILTRS